MGRDFEIVEVHAPEDNSSIRRGWQEPHVATHGGVETDAFDLYRMMNCMLISHLVT
jgi:hypothetical protein